MFRDQETIQPRLNTLVETFRQKGATNPQKAMTIQELGLPPRFEEAMHRRLGQWGIFLETNGKYYLNEERLKPFKEQRPKHRPNTTRETEPNRPGGQTFFRIAGPLLILPFSIVMITTAFYYLVNAGTNYLPEKLIIIVLIILLVLPIAQLLLWRTRGANA